MIHLGCDPGAHGCVTILGSGKPTIILLSSVTWQELAAILRVTSDTTQSLFAIVESTTRPPKLTRSQGRIEGQLDALRIPFENVTPGIWQRTLGLTKKKSDTRYQHKKRLRQAAQQRWPEIKMSMGDWNDAADSMLIADYARRIRS